MVWVSVGDAMLVGMHMMLQLDGRLAAAPDSAM